MSDIDPVTSLAATGSVTSRFVSSNELDEAKKRREEEWKAAYARCVLRLGSTSGFCSYCCIGSAKIHHHRRRKPSMTLDRCMR